LAVDELANLTKKEGFVIPFLFDADMKSVLDYACHDNDHKSVNALVRLLGKSPLDHHSRMIAHLIPHIVSMDLPACEKYFDKRRFQPGSCIDIQSGKLRIPSNKQCVARPSDLLADKEHELRGTMMDSLFKEKTVTMEILDMPLQ
jgi:hypothetical protein